MFVNVNPQSTLLLGQARGAAICAAVAHALPVAEYTALQVKQAVVGNGKAHKEQVQEMVRRLLELPGDPSPDAADALACAICHAHGGQGYGGVGIGRRRRAGPPGMSRILLAWELGSGFGHLGAVSQYRAAPAGARPRAARRRARDRRRQQGARRAAGDAAPGAVVPEYLRRTAGAAAELCRNPDALRLSGSADAARDDCRVARFAAARRGRMC